MKRVFHDNSTNWWHAQPLRQPHQIGHRPQTQLAHQTAAVDLDVLLAGAEVRGDLLVHLAGDDVAEHLPFPWRQARESLAQGRQFLALGLPIRGALQFYRLTDALQRQLTRLASAGRLTTPAPVLTFQSVLDFTVSTPAIISGLYARLPENGIAPGQTNEEIVPLGIAYPLQIFSLSQVAMPFPMDDAL